MTKADECIRDKDWGGLALITCEAMKKMKARKEKSELIKTTRNKGNEVRNYEIDKGMKVRLRKR